MEMEMERRKDFKGDEDHDHVTVDWRGRPSNPLSHGGMRAAAFVLGKFLSLHLVFRFHSRFLVRLELRNILVHELGGVLANFLI